MMIMIVNAEISSEVNENEVVETEASEKDGRKGN